MNFKNYKQEDLSNEKYAILESDAEDPWTYIISLHKEYDKAKKRLDHLRKQAKRDFDKGISTCDYILVETDNEKIRKCFNFEVEDE